MLQLFGWIMGGAIAVLPLPLLMAKRIARKQTRRKAPQVQRKAPKIALWRLLLGRLIIGSLICLGIFAYTVDDLVRVQIEFNEPIQPARVLARPLLLKTGEVRAQKRLVERLQTMTYQRVNKLSAPGQFVVGKQTLDVSIGHFSGLTSDANSGAYRLSFADGQLRQITAHADGQALSQLSFPAQPIGRLQLGPYEDRINMPLAQFPERLLTTLLVMEDRAFLDHHGVDVMAVLRAIYDRLRHGGQLRGASTITQQLVKNKLLSPERSISRKIIEAAMALMMERRYNKSFILETYLNEIFLGQSGNRALHGFALASQYFFAKPMDQLSVDQIALLVGIIPAPSNYNPRRHPERAKKRRNLVLQTLARVGEISAEEAAELQQKPLGLSKHAVFKTSDFPAYMDYAHRQLRASFSEEDLHQDGLQLYTTLDAWLQHRAKQALSSGLKKLEAKQGFAAGTLQGALVTIDAQSGDILALVGDRRNRFVGFNRAVDAARPIGSLIKPLVFARALQNPRKFSLLTPLDDSEYTYAPRSGEAWQPQNYDRRFRGEVRLLDALVNSYNVPTVRVGMELGLPAIVDMLQRFGITRKVAAYPSLLLGATEHSPLEIAQMYQVFANGGERVALRSVREIRDGDGVVRARYPEDKTTAIHPAVAYLINYAMQKVVSRGTARSLNGQFSSSLGLAGKTGTTNNYRDSWFAGFSKRFVTVVWVGRDDNKPINLTGSQGALTIWSAFMQQLPLQANELSRPDTIAFVDIDKQSGARADNNCVDVEKLPFIDKYLPKVWAPCANRGGKVWDWFNIPTLSDDSVGKAEEKRR